MTAQLSTAVSDLADRQRGVVARHQLLELGLSAKVVGYRARPGGPWQTLLPGVYLTHTGSAEPLQRMMAGQLYAGSDSVITGPAAMFHHGLGARDLSMIHVLIPADRRRRSILFVQVERTKRMPTAIFRRGAIRFAPVPRVVMDTARGLSTLRDVRAVIADSVQMGRCTVRELVAELDDGPMRRSARARTVLMEVSHGIRSTAEGDLLDILRTCGLPMPLLNPSLYLGGTLVAKPDAWWPDAGVAVEVDSREWHFKPADWEQTMARHNRMTAAGIAVLHFPPSRLRKERKAVTGEIRTAYNQGRRRPPLPIHAVPLVA